MDSTKEEGSFLVKMYESEYRRIQAWVAEHQHLETGGDLFGLWADDNTAVVQLVLGPGENCKRTGASFYQDVEYLERVGNVLTNKEGLCHIGEWHSHHRLGLTKPSRMDENTVWTNMDRYGIKRFFLFIATIEGGCSRKGKARYSSTYDVKVCCFSFEVDSETRKRKPVLQGQIIKLISDNVQESPFRINSDLAEVLAKGAETKHLLEERFKESTNYEPEETTRNENQKGSMKGKANKHPRPQDKKGKNSKSSTDKRKTNQTQSNKGRSKGKKNRKK